MFAWEVAGAVFTLIAGTLWHFAFDWLGRWPPLGIFFPVNESVWEHLKLVFWPILLFALLEYLFVRGRVNNFLLAKAASAYAAMAFIVLFFYAYTAIWGRDVFWLDILSFVLAVALSLLVSWRILQLPGRYSALGEVATAAVVLAAAAFAAFTFYPPALPMWRDSSTGDFGLAVPAAGRWWQDFHR